MESVNKAGHLMSLAALQQYDPYINKLLDVTGQVALYKFNSKANEWEKTDIEGTLFVYARSASPHHGFTIMNRLSTKNLVEPINKDLEFQLQDPFLLYRNANLGIYSIWFYDKADCQRIAQLMVQIVKHETVRAQRASPDRGMTSRTNGCVEAKPIDILELLSKAKEEYHRSQSGELELLVSAEAAQSQDLVKGLGDTPDRRISAAPQEKPPHSGVKQITVEELFGSSLPKDPAPPGPNPPDVAQPEGFLRGLSYGPLPLPLEPLLSQRLTADPGGSGGERPLGPVLVPLLQAAVGPRDPPRASTSPCLVAAGVVEPLAVLCGPPGPPAPPPAYMNPLKADGPPLPMPVPGLAPSFLAGPLVTPQSFRESTPKPPPVFTGKSLASAQSKDVDTFAPPQSLVRSIPPVSMKAGLVVAGEEPSLLLSPSAFQHMVAKMTEPARNPAPPSSPPVPFGGGDQHTVLYSKTQLQDTLIHLIKNDPSFLSAIHEAYLQSLSKDLNNMKL